MDKCERTRERRKSVKRWGCIAALASCLVGCAMFGANRNTSPYEDFITVDVFSVLANRQGIQSGWFAKVVREKFNMELNIIAPNVTGGGDMMYQSRFVAGNLGDLIILGTENGRFDETVRAGLLLDMTDYLADSDLWAEYGDLISTANENLHQKGVFGIPSEISSQSPDTPSNGLEPSVAPYVRWDVYGQIGYPKVETLEDWLPVMEQMQEAMPESDSGEKTYAISLFKDWDGNMMVAAKNYASLYGYNEVGFVLSRADGSDDQDVMDEDGLYMRCIRFLYEANQRGLIDPESKRQNWSTLYEKYRDGQILTSLWSYQGMSVYNTVEHTRQGKGFMPMLIEDMTTYTDGCYSQGNYKTVIAVGSQAQDPQRMVDFIDWLYSPEGMEISGQSGGAAGPEGLTWEMQDGKPVLTEFGKDVLYGENLEVPEEWGGGMWNDGVSALNFKPLTQVDTDPKTGEPYMFTLWSSEMEQEASALETDWQTFYDTDKSAVEFFEEKGALMVGVGTTYVQEEDSKDILTLRSQCKTVIAENSWKLVFAEDEEEFQEIWEETQKTLKGLGYEQVLAVDMESAKELAKARIQALQEQE